MSDEKGDFYFWVMFLIAMNNIELNSSAIQHQKELETKIDLIIEKLNRIEKEN